MLLISWLSSLKNSPSRRMRRSRRSRRKQIRRRLPAAAEHLEERVMLTAQPVGDELLVNTFTSGTQRADQQSGRTVATAPDDSFVVAWGSNQHDGSGWGVYGQRFGSDGTELGGEFQVNTYTRSDQESPALAVAEDGRFVIAWQSNRQDGSGWGIYAQLYNSDGTPDGVEFRVNETTRSSQRFPSVAFLADGGFVVTWSGRGEGDRNGIFARLYEADGTPRSGEILVNQTVDKDQRDPAVAPLAGGGFVVAWHGRGPDNSDEVFARQFDADGTPLSDEIQVNETSTGHQRDTSVTSDDNGRFIVAWQGNGPGDSEGTFVRQFDTDGTPLDHEIRVNETTHEEQRFASVAAHDEGSFVVSWSGHGTGDTSGVFVRQFDAGGTPLTGEQLVNSTTEDSQRHSSLATTSTGFLVNWSGRGIGDSSGVFLQQFANQPPILDPIGDQTVNEESSLVFTATASDPDSTPSNLTFSLDPGAPKGATIDPTTGLFSWMPTESDGPGTFTVTVRVTDDDTPALDDSETISISVVEVNEPPVLDAIGDKSGNEGEELTFTATASDPDIPANMLTFSLDIGAPDGASIDPSTGVFTWTPSEAQGPGSFSVTVRVTDDDTPPLDDSETITITVNEVNEPPVLDAIGDRTINEGEELTFTATASDPDIPANMLTFSLESGAPDGASIDPSTGVFTWTPSEAQGPGEFPVTVRVTDDGSPMLDDSETITITVIEVNEPSLQNLVPVFTTEPVMLAVLGREYEYDADASDPDGDPLTFRLMVGPEAAAIDENTGLLTWSPTESDLGTHTIIVRVEDENGGVFDQKYDLAVVNPPSNGPPVFTSIPVTEATVSTPDKSVTIDFETIPGSDPVEGLEITDQFLKSHGVTFAFEGGGAPLLSEVGAPVTAFYGAPNLALPDTPLPNQGVGSFFLTDAGSLPPSPLIVTLAQPVADARGVILDIEENVNGFESWDIEARNSNGTVLEIVSLDLNSPGAGDGLAAPWAIQRSTADISSIRIVFTGTQPNPGYAIDNLAFSTPSAPTFVEDFDDNATNTSIWTSFVEGSGPSVAETNQRLEITHSANSADDPATSRFGAGYRSLYQLRGDFDIQVDFELLGWPSTNGIRVGLQAFEMDGSRRNVERTSFGSSNDFPGEPREVYLTHFADGVASITATNQLSGKLRLVRLGTTLTGYYFDSNTWVPIHTGTSTTNDVHFGFSSWSHNSVFTNQEVKVAFDNFVINSGQLIDSEGDPVREITYRYDADAIDPDFDSVSYSLLEGPEGMVVDPVTGLVTWAPTIDDLNAADAPVDPSLPVVDGFDVEVYANVIDPVSLSFDPAGVLYTGRDNTGSGGGFQDPVRIHRIAGSGREVDEFGDTPIGDPDAVLFDPTGVVSGTPGSILVGGDLADLSGAQISAVLPDETVITVFGPSNEIGNVSLLRFDNSDRLLIVGNSNNSTLVHVFADGTLTHLFTTTEVIRGLAIAGDGRIFTSERDGVIRIYDKNGQLVDDNFASGLNEGGALEFGMGGEWGTDLYLMPRGTGHLLRFDMLGNSTLVADDLPTSGPDKFAFGPDGALFVTDFENDRILRIASSRETLGLGPNQHLVKLVASDGRGGTATQQFLVNVRPDEANHAPIIISEPVTSSVLDEGDFGETFIADLNEWDVLVFPDDVQPSEPEWQISEDGTIATQLHNSELSYLLSDFDEFIGRVEGTFRVDGFLDDDHIGLLWGYQDADQTYRLSWHSRNRGQLVIFRTDPAESPDAEDPKNTILYSAEIGWQHNTDYQFSLVPTPDGFMVTISSGNTAILSEEFEDATYKSGRFGFSSGSQARTQFREFNFQPLLPPEYTYDVEAIDADRDTLTYSLTTALDGMTINPDTGLIEWNPPADILTANQVTFFDGDFNPIDWESTVITRSAGGTASFNQVASGGNPGVYGRVDISLNAAPAGELVTVASFNRRIGAEYNPQTQGAILSIDYSEDILGLIGAFGQGPGLAIRQNDQIFVAKLNPNVLNQWETNSLTGLTANDFELLTVDTANFRFSDPGVHPDFSENGAPIEFGFIRSNGTNIGPTGSVPPTAAGIDNWRVTVTSAPAFDVAVHVQDGRGGTDRQNFSVGFDRAGAIHGSKFNNINADGLWQRKTDLFVAGSGLQRFDGTSGVIIDDLDQEFAVRANSLAVGPDGIIYVVDDVSNKILRFDVDTGAKIDSFATLPSEVRPAFGLEFTPDGDILVADEVTADILRIDGSSGELLGTFVDSGSLRLPVDFEFGPNGNLFVAYDASTQRIAEYNGQTGAFVKSFAFDSEPRGFVFGSDSLIYFSRGITNKVDRYDPATGNFVDTFVSSGSGGLDRPGDIKFGPDGHLYVVSERTDQILRYDGKSGAFIDAFVSVDSTFGLSSFVFTTPSESHVPVYFNDFENPSDPLTEWSNAVTDTTPVGARNFLGQFNNETTTLSIDELPPHSEVTVAFDLYVIQSWDGNDEFDTGGNVIGPDVFEVVVQGASTPLLSTTFSNNDVEMPQRRQSYPDPFPGGDYPATTGASEVDSLGYSLFGDSVYRLSFTFEHVEDVLQIDFSAFGLQSIDDESWGLDNVLVTTSLVEPGLEGFTIYLDENRNNVRDAGERFTITDTNGQYTFTDLAPGTYRVAEELQPGWIPTHPSFGFQEITVGSGETTYRVDFGNIESNQTLGNVAPTFTSDPLVGASVDQTYLYDAEAFDANGDALTFDLPVAPAGMAIDPSTGIVAWAPRLEQLGVHDVVLRVRDGQGGVDIQSYQVTVGVGNAAPIFTSTPPKTAVVDLPFQYQAVALDPDRDPVTHELLSKPDGMEIVETTGLITWTPVATQLGPQQVILAASDDRGGETLQIFEVEVLAEAPNDPPEITSTPRNNLTLGTTYLYDTEAIDPNNDPITYTLLDGPDNADIDPTTGLITWTPTADDLNVPAADPPTDPTLPVVDGFDVEVYANVTDPVGMSFDPTGVLYVGRDNVGSGGTTIGPARIHRVSLGGVVVEEFGTQAIEDPDLVLFDAVGFSSSPGSVLVGGELTAGGGSITAIRPNESVETLFGPSTEIGNVLNLTFDKSGRLLLTNFNTDEVLISDGDEPTLLFTLPPEFSRALIAIDPSNRIFARSRDDGEIGIFSLDGSLLDPAFATGIGTGFLQFGPGGIWGTDLYFTNNESGELLRLDGQGDSTVIGTGFENAERIEFGPDGALYVAMFDEDRILRIAPNRETLGLDPNEHRFLVTATDGRGGADTQEFTVRVRTEFDNAAPEIVSNPPLAATVGRQYQYEAVVEDPDGDPVLWSLDVAPAGMTIDVNRGTVAWVPTAGQLGGQDVVVRVVDAFGAAATQEFTVTVRITDLPPVISSFPVTDGAVGALYEYQVEAADPEGDPLSYSLPVAPAGMTIGADGLIQWTPEGTQFGPQQVSILVADTQGSTASQTYTLVVSEIAVNRPPVITSVPPFEAAPDELYEYQVTAFDPEGETPTFLLLFGPDGLTLDSGTGLLTWTPTPDQIGTHTVSLAAVDSQGAAGTQRFAIVVEPNEPPRIDSSPTTQVTAGLTYRYNVRASDPNNDPLRFRLDEAPEGMTIDANGRITWQTTLDDLGGHDVQVTVIDEHGESFTQSFELIVEADQTPPEVELQIQVGSQIILNEDPAIQVGTQVRLRTSAFDNIAVVSRSLTSDGVPLTLDADGTATQTFDQVGFFEVVASATDAAGNVGTASRLLRILDPAAEGGPFIEIASPESGTSVTYLTDIVGTITVEPDNELEFYRVEYARYDQVNTYRLADSDPDYVTIVDVNVADVGPIPNLENEVLATFDPTLLMNDAYVVRVIAGDVNGIIQAEGVLVSVDGNAKLGNFRLEFTDLSIPLAGIPIEITRTYDTLQAGERGQFGFGWTLGIQEADIRETVPFTGSGIFAATPFEQGTRVFLTTPDGQRVGFTFEPELFVFEDFNGNLTTGFFPTYFPRFTPDPGVYATLEVPESNENILSLTEDGQAVIGFFGFAYNPDVYILTMPDGTKYHYNQFDGLEFIADRNGNQVTFTDSGVFHSSGESIQFIRDEQGRIKEIIDPDGNSLIYTYDANGDLVLFENQEHLQTGYTYKPERHHFLDEIFEVREPENRLLLKTQFDENGRLVGTTDALGNAVQQSFDPSTFTGTFTDAEGNVTEFLYNERGNVLWEEDPLDNKTFYEYGDPNNPDLETRIIDRRGMVTEREYDARGNVVTIVELGPVENPFEQPIVTSLTYNTANQVTSIKNALDHTTAFAYDTRGNLMRITNAEGNSMLFTYDDQGRRETFTDFNENTTTLEYHEACGCGSPSKVTFADGTYQVFNYNSYGQVKLAEFYEADGTLVERRQTKYDNLGRVVEEIGGADGDPAHPPTIVRSFYEGQFLDYQVVINPESLDANGNLLESPDTPVDQRKSSITHFEYDSAGRIVQQTDAEGGVVGFRYDANGNRILLQDPVGNVTTWVYDDLNRVVEERDPLYWVDFVAADPDRFAGKTGDAFLAEIVLANEESSGASAELNFGADHVTVFDYDAEGNRTEVIDRNGRRSEFNYDHAGRLEEERWYDADTAALVRTLSFTYDAIGNMSTASDPDSNYAFTYDVLNRLRTVDNNPDGTRDVPHVILTYDYDPQGNVTLTQDNFGVAVESEYDERNRLKTRKWFDADVPSGETADIDPARVDFLYNAAGRKTLMSRFADLDGSQLVGKTTTTYDLVGRSDAITHVDALDQLFARYTYDYDYAGLLVHEERTHQTSQFEQSIDYAYDLTGQLVDALFSGQDDENYGYDPNGNRTASSVNGSDITTETGNRTTSDGTFEYEYDGEGSLKRKTEIATGDVTEFTYDHRNRLTGVVEISSGGVILSEVEYTYDVFGRRIAKSVNGTETHFVYNGDNVWADFDGEGNVVVRYLFGNQTDEIVARFRSGEGTAWYLPDRLGTVRDIVDATGATIYHIDYDAFGRILGQTNGPAGDRFSFTGREFDVESGLYYYRARYYDPSLGRFISEDPMRVEANDANLYRYAMNAPTDRIDPTGTISFSTRTITDAVRRLGSSALIISRNALIQLGSTPIGLSLFSLFTSVAATVQKFGPGAVTFFGNGATRIGTKIVAGLRFPTFQTNLQGGVPTLARLANSIAGRFVPLNTPVQIGQRFVIVFRDSKGGIPTLTIVDKLQGKTEVIRGLLSIGP